MLPSFMTPTQKASARGVQEINISRGKGGGNVRWLVNLLNGLGQGCTNPGGQITPVTTFCTVEPHVCGSSVWICHPSHALKFEEIRRFF